MVRSLIGMPASQRHHQGTHVNSAPSFRPGRGKHLARQEIS